MRMMLEWAGTALLFVALSSACGNRDADSTGAAPDPSANAVNPYVAAVENGAVLLDVRTPEEFAQGHIRGAINIPVQELEARMGELDRAKPLLVYCRSGNRSGTAQAMLSQRGFEATNIGGISEWPNPSDIVRD